MDLLTNSRMKSFRACSRRHHLEYVEGYRPAQESEALAFGTLTHSCLEAYWLARQSGGDPESWLRTALDVLPANGDPFDAAKLRPMLIAYAAAWADVACEVLAVEREFRLPLVNPLTNHPSRTWVLAGKLDLVIRLSDGRIAVVDHKTSSESIEPGSDYRRRLILDGQLSQYWRGCESLGWAPDLGIWDVLGKPALRPLKATPVESRKYTKDGRLYANQRETDETPDEYEIRIAEALAADPAKFFARVEVARLEVEREQYDANVWHLATVMREAKPYGRAIYNPDACMRGRSPCPFLAFCEGTASLDDESLFRRVDQDHPHEELSANPSTHAA
jgi:hypothetical protein